MILIRNIFVFLFLCFSGVNCLSQHPSIDSCHEIYPDNIFCTNHIEILADSAFIHTSGCERDQFIQIGKLSHIDDTVYLRKCDLSFDCIFDSIEFITNDQEVTDTIDIFYFGKHGNHSYAKYNFVAYRDTSIKWPSEKNINRFEIPEFDDFVNYSRDYAHFKLTGSSLLEEHPFYGVDDTYVVSTSKELGLYLIDFYLWTGNKKVVSIPKNTTRINVHYALPDRIISDLQLYSVRIDHNEPVVVFECGGSIYKIE